MKRNSIFILSFSVLFNLAHQMSYNLSASPSYKDEDNKESFTKNITIETDSDDINLCKEISLY